MIHDISKQIRNKQDYLAFFEYLNSLLKCGLIEEKLILFSLILVIVKGINTDYLLDEQIKETICSQINKTKNILKISYELAINDIIEDLKSRADSPKKLYVKHKSDPSNETYEAFVLKNLNDKNSFVQVLQFFLETLKN